MKSFKSERQKVSYALGFSIFLHVGFLACIYKVTTSTSDMFPSKISSNKITKNNSIRLDEIKFISPEKLKAIKTALNKQVVANETNGKKALPNNSRFLGEKDQTFDRQTMANKNGAFKEAGLGQKNGSQVLNPVALDTPKPAPSTKKKSPVKALSLSDLGEFKIEDLEKRAAIESENLEKLSQKMAVASKSSALGLDKGKSGKLGLSQSNDFVEDIPLGDMTNLNTTEFKYYGFYHRIRQQLEQHWGSTIKDKAKNLYRSGRRMPASDNLITSVKVTLDPQGQIVDMQIEGTSGVRELDQAAIESFNKAGPFPNPPKGLLVGGRATIQWGFVVKS